MTGINIKTMILAAGFGTRLQPLTFLAPKPLMPIANIPLLDRILGHLLFSGVYDVVINTYYMSDKVTDHFSNRKEHIIPKIIIEDKILGTGGGIVNMATYLDSKDFLVVNGDIYCYPDLGSLIDKHKKTGAWATLLLHNCEGLNKISVNNGGFITEIPEGYPRLHGERYAFTGIQIISRKAVDRIPKGNIFSDIMDCYRELIKEGKPIVAHIVEGMYWCDIVNPFMYMKANRHAMNSEKLICGKDSIIPSSVCFADWAIVGSRVKLGINSTIRRSVIWDDVIIDDNSVIEDAVVTKNGIVCI